VEGEVLLKISILIYSMASGGAERQVSILLKELSKNYKVQLVLMNDTIFYDIPDNVEIVFLEKSNPKESGIIKFLKLPFLGWKYKKLTKSFDISLSFMNRPNYINVFSKFFGNRAKVIVSERGTPSIQYKIGIQGAVNRFLIKWLYKKADLVVSNSKGNAYDLNKNFGIKNVKTIYNFVEKKDCEKNDLKNFVFINIGRMDQGKNQKLLIKAFKKANINAKLWLIGDGPLKKELEELVKKLNLENKILFLGKQKNVFKFLSKAKCFVFSSNNEGFPNVLLEALSCSLPIISTDCKFGPREILAPDSDFRRHTNSIEIAEYGVLTKVDDEKYLSNAIKLMFNNEKLRYNFAKKAKSRVKDFEVKKIIKEWIKVIDGK
jgi:N-acetylgalactosamine-N,N'-diacetylbacillosaminyl-diphospho-undecaprenol 4-alpha-N-acetylgalactosaminyltransferase